MPTPIAYSVRPCVPNGNTVTVTNARTNVTIANFPVASGAKNLLLSGDTLTVVGQRRPGPRVGPCDFLPDPLRQP